MSMAVAYAMKKRAKKTSDGACDEHGAPGCEMCGGGKAYMAKGGMAKKEFDADAAYEEAMRPKGTHDYADPKSFKLPHFTKRHAVEKVAIEHQKAREENRPYDMDNKNRSSYMAEGGMIEDDEDMVGRIMKKRGYSKGGQVANDTPPIADFEDNQFDDLVKDDDLEFHYDGANSGDELGNMREDEDRHDIVAKIMRSRRMRDMRGSGSNERIS